MRITNLFESSSRFVGLCLLMMLAGSGGPVGAAETPGGIRYYLRGAYQYGSVLQTNEFVEGDNLKGRPIDTFHSLRLEFGWQTDVPNPENTIYRSYFVGPCSPPSVNRPAA